MAERIKLQETVLRFIRDGAVETELADIQSADFDFDMELLSEGFAGETTDRKDDIFNGCSGRMSLQLESKEAFDPILAVINRARRKIPLFTVELTGLMQFPNGETVMLLFTDIRFGKFGFSAGNRKDYWKLDIEWGSSEFERLDGAFV